MQKTTLHRDASDDNETNDDIFHDLTQTSDIPPLSHFNSNSEHSTDNSETPAEVEFHVFSSVHSISAGMESEAFSVGYLEKYYLF